MATAETLDHFLPGILSQDTKKRLDICEEVMAYLRNTESSLYCEEMDKFVDGLASWINSSSFKISMQGLELISCLIDRMSGHFKSHVTTVLSAVIDRLGDSKDQVRESAREVLRKLMSPASSPQYVLERLTPAFTHKLWKVREESLICVQRALNDFGAKSLTLSKLVPLVVKLLEDPSLPVREQAVCTIVEMYRHVGERLRVDLSKKDINPAKLNVVLAKMDEIRSSGLVFAADVANGGCEDDTDSGQNMASSKLPKRSSSSSRAAAVSTLTKTAKPSAALAGAAGAVDEDIFVKQFEEVPKLYVTSAKDVNDLMTRIREVLCDVNLDWEKRVTSLKEIRSAVIAGTNEYAEFQPLLRSLEPALRLSVQDLRSQVVREACITIAYLSQYLAKDFDHVAEALLPSLIQLIPNSAKIISSSGITSIRFIIQSTHSPRLIPLICSNMTSKSPVIRRFSCEFIDQILHIWPTHVLERQMSALIDVIRKGLCDADPDARVNSRRAFWGFEEHFKDQSLVLFNSLDSSQQKQLQSVKPASNNAYGTNSVNAMSQPTNALSVKSRPRSVSTDRSAFTTHSRMMPPSSHVSRAVTGGTSKAARVSRDATDGAAHTDCQVPDSMLRSCSSANLTSRLKASLADSSSNYNSLRHSQSITDLSPSLTTPKSSALPLRRNQSMKMTTSASRLVSGCASSSRPKKSSVGGPASSDVRDAAGNRSGGKSGMSLSQPGSRSGSPSSRLSYITHTQPDVVTSAAPLASRVPARAPYSQGSSRDGSPSRMTGFRDKRSVGSMSYSAGHTDIGMSNHLLQPNTDMEAVVAGALLQRMGSMQYQAENIDNDDELGSSETSSLCSETSFRSSSNTSEDVTDAITSLASNVWSDRRDGLLGLQSFLRAKRKLNRAELKRVTDVLSRMFQEPHGKVFVVFLDTLIDLVSLHGADVNDWLYVCLSRLINRMGVDMLGSVQTKLLQTVEAVRDSFPCDSQFSAICKFIVDHNQNPNTKVKVAVLNYMHNLTMLMDPSHMVNNSDTRLALTKVITWTTEPKSADIRKASQAVLLSMFSLNTPVFTDMLRTIPKTFQDGANKILQTHAAVRSTAGEAGPLSPHNVSSLTTSRMNQSFADVLDSDTENLNPDEMYDSIRKASVDIQNLNRLDGDGSVPVTAGRSSVNQSRVYNPVCYQDQKFVRSPCSDGAGDVETDIFSEELPADPLTAVEVIVNELAHHNQRNEERQLAMKQLISLIRNSPTGVWSEHFKTILLLILETLADSNDQVRVIALRVLREIVRRQPERFCSYAELTILKLLEAQRDSVKEVNRAAEECAAAVARAIQPEQCINILNPFIDTAEFPINLAAIKMQIKVIESVSDKDIVKQLLPDMTPRLLKGYDNAESSVRKASVFCLVAVYLLVGEDLRPYLNSLNSSKLKLLNLYIKRALSQKNDESGTETSSSPVTVIENL